MSRIGGGQPWYIYTIAALVGVAYLSFSYSLVKDDIAAGYRMLHGVLPAPIQRCLPQPSTSSSGGTGGSSSAPVPPGSPDVKQQLASPLMPASAKSEVVVGVSSSDE